MKTGHLLFVLVPLLLSACASTSETKNKEAAVTTPPKQEVVVEKPASEVASTAGATTPTLQVNQLQELQKKSVYFDFDKFDVKAEYRDVIQQQSDYVKANPSSVTVEGNADERGSSEYNLALGNKRAAAVAKMMGVLGVKRDQINVVSFGEEKPRTTCHDETCWAENRRVDFNLKPAK